MRTSRSVVVAAVLVASPACHRSGPLCVDGARIVLDAPAAPVGFDGPFSIHAATSTSPACPDARAGHIAWRQIAGVAVRAPAVSDDGFTYQGRAPAFRDVVSAPVPWGIVPLSPRTRGELVLQATWRDDHGHVEQHEVRVWAAARSRGLANAPVGARLYLGGAGWHVVTRPAGAPGHAAVEMEDGVASLLPDVAGDWHLADGAGRDLTVRATGYDQTPLDCGRSGCHASLADAAAGSAMTTVLARGLTPALDGHGAAFGVAYPGCALGCHATGEPGVDDGGFSQVMGELGIARLAPQTWAQLPRPLRRLGGVGCLACHGPGALPDESARWAILRTDVCAVCHDAPPRYGHVAAWRQTAMARADRDPRAASDRACARCHTTWGFLAATSPTERAAVNRRPPPTATVGTIGITCAACHAVHSVPISSPRLRGKGEVSHGEGSVPSAPTPALLRAPPPPALLANLTLQPTAEKSRVCLGCHTPDATEKAPSASSAALWLGRGGLDPATGQPLLGATPHGAVAGGCVGCHRAGPSSVEHGAGHAFAPSPASCTPCHAQPLPADNLRARALALWAVWRARAGDAAKGSDGPPHAGAAPGLDRRTPLGRAAWDLSLVLEDPAAATHNASYARVLLAAAERILKPAASPGASPRGGTP